MFFIGSFVLCYINYFFKKRKSKSSIYSKKSSIKCSNNYFDSQHDIFSEVAFSVQQPKHATYSNIRIG